VRLWDLGVLTALHADSREWACSLTVRGLDADDWARSVPDLTYEDSCAS
jgi:hypothetical protein